MAIAAMTPGDMGADLKQSESAIGEAYGQSRTFHDGTMSLCHQIETTVRVAEMNCSQAQRVYDDVERDLPPAEGEVKDAERAVGSAETISRSVAEGLSSATAATSEVASRRRTVKGHADHLLRLLQQRLQQCERELAELRSSPQTAHLASRKMAECRELTEKIISVKNAMDHLGQGELELIRAETLQRQSSSELRSIHQDILNLHRSTGMAHSWVQDATRSVTDAKNKLTFMLHDLSAIDAVCKAACDQRDRSEHELNAQEILLREALEYIAEACGRLRDHDSPM